MYFWGNAVTLIFILIILAELIQMAENGLVIVIIKEHDPIKTKYFVKGVNSDMKFPRMMT